MKKNPKSENNEKYAENSFQKNVKMFDLMHSSFEILKCGKKIYYPVEMCYFFALIQTDLS